MSELTALARRMVQHRDRFGKFPPCYCVSNQLLFQICHEMAELRREKDQLLLMAAIKDRATIMVLGIPVIGR